MDLSFARSQNFARSLGTHVTVLPVELAVLLVGVVSRQAASPTARVQALLSRGASAHARLAPRAGAFDAATAQALTRWQQE
ncbi:hypothetical protein M9980_12320 [Sphingomonas donggukensis]|uniref:Peptidoglycan binding-like domain-containing protein n=1 Tax=Sphingomonas donggukensis TaxID=2949093 RepID=A0ABY4TSD9_9SPHN|nr:hypothetical protein [Sphingomonas donggukensis]URW75311.1 hypothetical protein M9980_12320 [Sphingomonas donggukensis]